MKKINMNRLAAALLVLVLLTSCFVGSTMARYATGTSANDTARAAKFGVTISGYSDVFGKNYLMADNNTVVGNGTFTVESGDGNDVVAPGTKGDNVLVFSIEGSTEVAVTVKLTLNENSALKMITLPAKQEGYTDYTTFTMAGTKDGTGSYDKTFAQASDYNPIQWTLKRNGTEVVTKGTLQDVETYLQSLVKENDEDKVFAAKTDLSDAFGEFKLSWEWPIGTDNVKAADTYIGKVANDPTLDTSVELNETFSLKIYIEQVD